MERACCEEKRRAGEVCPCTVRVYFRPPPPAARPRPSEPRPRTRTMLTQLETHLSQGEFLLRQLEQSVRLLDAPYGPAARQQQT